MSLLIPKKQAVLKKKDAPVIVQRLAKEMLNQRLLGVCFTSGSHGTDLKGSGQNCSKTVLEASRYPRLLLIA